MQTNKYLMLMKTYSKLFPTSIFLKVTAVILILPLLKSCDDDEGGNIIWDIVPSDIVVHVVDHNGNNLLLPETPGYINPEEVAIEYKGKTYEYVNTSELEYPCYYTHSTQDNGTRAILCTWYGLHEGHNADDPTLNIGQLAPEDDYRNEQFDIIWPDGRRDRIGFDLFFIWKNDRTDFLYIKNLYLNGNPVETITIEK